MIAGGESGKGWETEAGVLSSEVTLRFGGMVGPSWLPNADQIREPVAPGAVSGGMYDPTTPFQDELAKRLLRRAAALREEADKLASQSGVFRYRQSKPARRVA